MNTNHRIHHKCRHATRFTAMGLGMALFGLGQSSYAGPTITHGEQGSLTLNYELQIWMQKVDGSETVDTYDTFLRRNRITLMGQYNDYLGFYAQIEAGNDSKGGEDDKSTYYRDAYLTFDWSDAARVIVGRFKNTFSRENLEACLEPLTLDRSLISYTPFGGSRDTGVALWGNLADAALQYRLMMADGREDEDNVPKDNPRFTARIHYSAFDPEYSYGYRGTYLGSQHVLTIGAAYDHQADAVYANLPGREDPKDYSAWTVDLFYEQPTASGTFTFSSAYFEYSVDEALNGDTVLVDSAVPASAELEAYYVKAGYMLPGKVGPGRLQFFARHDSSDYNRNDNYYDNDLNAAGFNYYFNGQEVKLTVEYADVQYDEDHPTETSLKDYTQATVGLQMIF